MDAPSSLLSCCFSLIITPSEASLKGQFREPSS
jgi:hypothetical protein